jgi:DNA invertase Pin-like site-specific DNA recombinase
VSNVGGRSGERFASPTEQRERIEAECERVGLELVDTLEEMDVSGGAPLAKRPGLRLAVEAIEAGEAGAIVVSYLDRLVRSLTVQAEVVQRVEAAGGAILAVDIGQLTNGSAGQWLSGTTHGMMAAYVRRAGAERTHGSKQAAIDRGVPPFPNLPPGLCKREDGTVTHDPGTGPVIVAAFGRRLAGETVKDVRAFLAEHGIRRSFHGVTELLLNRLYLGEIHFGSFEPNLSAFPPLVDRDTFQRVQRLKVSRGRRAKSERLLARLGVLRCGTCGARMSVGTGQNRYAFYRCPPVGDCPRRVTISAERAEQAVTEAVQDALAGVEGTASIGEGVEAAARALDAAQGALDAAIGAFEAVMDERSARDRLAQLRAERDEAQEHLDRLSAAQAPAVTVTAGDWNDLTLDERRALIRAVVLSVTVAPGRGPDRLTIELRGE